MNEGPKNRLSGMTCADFVIYMHLMHSIEFILMWLLISSAFSIVCCLFFYLSFLYQIWLLNLTVHEFVAIEIFICLILFSFGFWILLDLPRYLSMFACSDVLSLFCTKYF